MPTDPQLLADLEKRCQEQGVPVTLQRRAILEVLTSRADHPTADEVVADLGQRMDGVSRATVYRTLETLAECGLLVRVCHPGAAARYDVNTQRHHHLVCDLCGSITDFEEPSLNGLSMPDLSTAGFRMRDFSVHVRGICENCNKNPKP